MKGYKITDTNFNQEVNLPAGTYTYSCRVIPVGTTYTFRIDTHSFTFEGLTAGVLSARIKYTFELTESGVVFYPSNTLGDSIFDPQIEEGIFATTPGAHALDFERLISEAGIEIDHEALSLYAKKAYVSAEIKIQADQINSTVGGLSNDVDELSNDVDGLRGSITSIEQTTTSISATVSNHTSQIASFQITVDQIYAAIEDAGSGEFSSILQRLDLIELSVGNISGDFSTLTQTVDGFEARVQTAEGNISTFQQTVDGISAKVYDEHDVLLSQITQDGENILIQAANIKLEGLVTANQNFKILSDGSIEAKNAIIGGQLRSPFATSILTAGTSQKYIDASLFDNFYVPTMPNGSNNGWYYTWLPTDAKYNGLTLNFMWNPLDTGLHWRIYSTSGTIYREDAKTNSLDFTSDTSRFIQLTGFWNTAANRLEWAVTNNIKVGDGYEDRVKAGDIILTAEISSGGTTSYLYQHSKFNFACSSWRDSAGVYQITIGKIPYNPLSSANYTPLVVPITTDLNVYAGVSNIAGTGFRVYARNQSGAKDTAFKIVLVANTDLDLRNQTGL